MIRQRGLVAALAVVLLLGGRARAADGDDLAQCRGSDPALAVMACSHIISDPDKPAPDRADAYVSRAGAYFKRGDVDLAIADDTAAIALAPRNSAAYAGRALAYFRKGDRDRAIIDFAIAHRLDPTATDETVAANAEFARIAALAHGPPPDAAGANVATAASPFCPTHESARLGFVLVDRKGLRRTLVNPSNGDVATNDYFVDGERAMTVTYYKGLLIIYGSLLESYINSYDIDYTRQGIYDVGDDTRYHVSTMTLAGTVTSITIERRVVGREKLVVGDCSFDTFVIETQADFPDGAETFTRSNFSPVLRMNLRFTTTTDGSQTYEVNYDLIEPLSR